MEKQKTKEKLLLIDANSIIHRAYHALPPLTGPNGEPTGALYGLASVLIRLLKEDPPQYMAAAFDRPEPTLRKQRFEQYKALRPPTPDDLISQLKESKNLMTHFGVKSIDSSGYEADDIIATLARRFRDKVTQVVVLSGDLDTLQLVSGDAIVAEIPQRGISETVLYNENRVVERLGVGPKMVADYKGLVGDKSDNIPGVMGIGPKTAVDLIVEYGGVEKIYKNLAAIRQKSATLATKLEDNKETAFLSKELATAIDTAPSPTDLNDLKIETNLGDNQKLHQYLEELGFKTLLERIRRTPEVPQKKMGKLF